MKKTLQLLLLLGSTTLAFGQGKIIFENDSLHLVYLTTDTTRLAPADVSRAGLPVSGLSLEVDLLAGPSASQLSLCALTTFSSTPGIFGPVTIALPGGFPGGTAEFFQVQVFDAATGSYAAASSETLRYYGESEVFSCVPGTFTPTSILDGWPPGSMPIPGGGRGSIEVQMNPVPEPGTLALVALGGVLLFGRRRCSR